MKECLKKMSLEIIFQIVRMIALNLYSPTSGGEGDGIYNIKQNYLSSLTHENNLIIKG